MVTAFETWVRTADREPPDGAPVEWPAGGRVVRGYRLGRRGRGLWVEPRGESGPEYHERPACWRPAVSWRPRTMP